MRIFQAVTALVLLCGSANAQHVVDGSGKEIAPETLKKVLQAVSDKLRDPNSAQLRRVSIIKDEAGDLICGQVNGKNGFGAYGGFVGFIFFTRTGVANVYANSFDDTEAKVLQDKHLKESGCPVW